MDQDSNATLLRLAEKMGGLDSSVRSLTEQWRNQDERASQGRRDMHQKLDALRQDVQRLDGEVRAAISDIALMKPTVEAVEAAKLQAEGAVTSVRWMSRAGYWVAMGMTLGAAWVLTNWLNIKVSLR